MKMRTTSPDSSHNLKVGSLKRWICLSRMLVSQSQGQRGYSQSGQQPLKGILQIPQFSSLATQVQEATPFQCRIFTFIPVNKTNHRLPIRANAASTLADASMIIITTLDTWIVSKGRVRVKWWYVLDNPGSFCTLFVCSHMRKLPALSSSSSFSNFDRREAAGVLPPRGEGW